MRDPADIVVRKHPERSLCRRPTSRRACKQIAPDRVFVTGWATDLCVDATVRSAVSNHHNVVVVTDAHTLNDRPHLDAASVIRHHHWVWGNLITPTIGQARAYGRTPALTGAMARRRNRQDLASNSSSRTMPANTAHEMRDRGAFMRLLSKLLAGLTLLLLPAAGLGAGFSRKTDQADRAVPGRRPQRHHRARDRPAHVRD